MMRRPSSVTPGGGRRLQDDGHAGLVCGTDRDPAHPAVSDVLADLEAEGVAVEGQGGLRVVVREEARVNGDVRDGQASCGSGADASRFLIGLVTCFATHDGIPAGPRAAWLPIDAEVATTQRRHRALDAPRHQIGVRRLAVGEPELAPEVPGRHVRAAGEHLDVQRLRVLPVDPVADVAQAREVAQVLCRGGSAGHLRDRPTLRWSCLAPLASHATPRPLWPVCSTYVLDLFRPCSIRHSSHVSLAVN